MANDQISPPDLTTLLGKTKASVRSTLNAVQIGIIQSFDASKQIADVQIAIRVMTDISPSGIKTYSEHPLLLQVPVITLFGGGSFLSMPITAGDTCILFFNDRDIDNFLLNGGIQPPNTPRNHDISDAIAIVGIRDFQHSIAAYLTNGIRLQFAGNSKIDLTNDAINSLAALFTHTGDARITGDLTVVGNLDIQGTGGVDTATIGCNITQTPGKVLKAGNGATGTFNVVTVLNGIVTGGS